MFWYTENVAAAAAAAADDDDDDDDDDDELENFSENEHFSNEQHFNTGCFKKQKFFLTENLDRFNKDSCTEWSVTFEFLVFLETLKCFYLLHNQFERKPVAFFLVPTEWNRKI